MVQGTKLKAKMEVLWLQELTRSERFLPKMLYVADVPLYVLYLLFTAKQKLHTAGAC
jgi:hypothetical protein